MKRRVLGGNFGWVRRPSLERESAAAVFGAPIPSQSWAAISNAFARHGRNEDALTASTANKNKNDPKGWTFRRDAAVKHLERAIDALNGIDHDFIYEADDAVSLEKTGGLHSLGFAQALNGAVDEMLRVVGHLADLAPIERAVLSDAESRAQLARDVFAALKDHGASVSDGRALDSLDGVSEADLTGFERLVSAFGIHESETPLGTAKWTREALAQKQG